MTPWLILVESNTSGTGPLFASAALRCGCRPMLLATDPLRYKFAQEMQLDTLKINTQDEQAILTACRRLEAESGVAGVTSSSEYYVSAAAKLARRLELPGPDAAAIRACRDKLQQRLTMQKAKVSIPRFAPAKSPEGAVEAACRLGFPVVVKPTSGSGSAGVRLCYDEDQVASHGSALLQQKINERGLPVPSCLLVEEAVDGPEYSVETFDHQVIGVTKKYLGALPDFIEVGHDYPAALSAEDEGRICRTALRAIKAMGLGWGPAHVELRVTADGPKIVEVNPRLAGGHIPDIVRLASGIDLICETVRKVIGLEPQLTRRVRKHASIRFILSNGSGTLLRAKGLEPARRVTGIVEAEMYIKPGDEVRRYGDFRDRLGHVIAVGKSACDARDAVELARELIKLEVGHS
jgi:biotin carboxylase